MAPSSSPGICGVEADRDSFAKVHGASLCYRFDGPLDAPVLVLSNSLGTNLEMWDAQVPSFARRFRLLRYDTRGHGASAVTPGPYTIERLAQDVLGLLDTLEIPRAHFCGLSMGGMIGMWLGAHAAQRIDRLVLCNTAPRMGAPTLYSARIDAVRQAGVESIADAVLGRWFSASFREHSPDALRTMREMLVATAAEGYIASCAAVRDADLWHALPCIDRPTLIISGAHDAATPPSDGRRMAEAIPGAKYVELDAAIFPTSKRPIGTPPRSSRF